MLLLKRRRLRCFFPTHPLQAGSPRPRVWSLNRRSSSMKPRNDETYTKIALTSLSAMAAETSTFPIDLIKTRLQLHGESLSSCRSTTAFRVAAKIVRIEGQLALYKGLSPAILRHLFYTPIRIVGYEQLRNSFLDGHDSVSLSGKALVGGISGVIAQVNSLSILAMCCSTISVCFDQHQTGDINRINITKLLLSPKEV